MFDVLLEKLIRAAIRRRVVALCMRPCDELCLDQLRRLALVHNSGPLTYNFAPLIIRARDGRITLGERWS